MSLASLTGCLGDIPGEGVYDSGSVLKVEAIDGTYLTETTNQVDDLLDMCITGTGSDQTVTPEKFSDHFATAQISNSSWPNAEAQTASQVYIKSYTITYQPISTGSPALDPYLNNPFEDTHGIPPCAQGQTCQATQISGLIFVDVKKKDEYRQKIGCDEQNTGPCFDEGEYLIRYTFYGENVFGKQVSCQGSTNFTITDYDHCD
jgi:hypothetical protein